MEECHSGFGNFSACPMRRESCPDTIHGSGGGIGNAAGGGASEYYNILDIICRGLNEPR